MLNKVKESKTDSIFCGPGVKGVKSIKRLKLVINRKAITESFLGEDIFPCQPSGLMEKLNVLGWQHFRKSATN